MTAFPTSTWIRPPRQRTGVLGLGILALVASTWLLVPQTLVLWDALVGGGDLGRFIEQGASVAVAATLVLAAGAVATRIVWLLVLAIPTLAVHGLVLVVVAIVVGASGAPGVVVLAHLGDAFAMLLATVAVVVALVATAAARAGDRSEGIGWHAALVLVGLAVVIVIAAPYLLASGFSTTLIGGTPYDPLVVLVSDTVLVVALVAVAMIAGVRAPAARWAAAGLAALTALWIVLLETVVLPWPFAATIAIASVRAVLLLLAGALIALSTRWLASPTGTAPPIVPPHAPAAPTAPPVVAAAPAVAPPVVPEPVVANPAAAAEPSAVPVADAPVEREHAPGVAADADEAIDQGDREVPEDAPTTPPGEDGAR